MSRYNVFDLPKELFESLRPLNLDGNVSSSNTETLTPASDPVPSKKSFEHDLEDGKNITCTYCGKLSAETAQELRDHYKKDYHRFNIKRKLRNEPIVSEEEFDKMADELDESISGSEDNESASDEDNEDGDDKVSALMKKTTLDPIQESQDPITTTTSGVKNSLVGSPYAFFTNDEFENQSKCLAIYKNIMNSDKLYENPMDALNSLNKDGHSVLVMIGGGHFSAAVIAHLPIPKQKPTISNPFPHIRILAHKTFHRYTTRRKQGGSQGASDASRGKANSAGSALRRYNEMALQNEVRELLESWDSYISSADNIYIRANGKTNRGVIANYEKAPISTRDSRVKNLPFSTSRATSTAIKRAWVELTTANVIDKPKKINKKEEQQPIESTNSSNTKEKKKTTAAAQEVSAEEKHTNELTGFIKKSRSPRVTAYLKTHKLSPDFQFVPESQYGSSPTPLFYASVNGSQHVVQTLLTSLNANPEIKNINGRYAYEVAADRATKDAFQLARYNLGEAKWNWNSAKVGPALTKKEIEDRTAKEKAELEQTRQEELKQLEEEEKEKKLENTVNKHGQGKKLTSSVATSISSEAGLRGLSDEARMRLERERRARAAEARFKKQMNGN